MIFFKRYLTCKQSDANQKWLDQKDKVNFKIYDVTAWLINN